jgi:hypothetical protein
MAYEINFPQNTTYFCACNPFLDIYHHGKISNINSFATGQLFMATASSEHEAIDMLFSSYNVNEDDNIVGEKRPFYFSVGYESFEEAQATVDFVHTFGFLYIKMIKHPQRDEWAIPYQDYMFSKIPESAEKEYLKAKHQEIVDKGCVRSLIEMLQEGWMGNL